MKMHVHKLILVALCLFGYPLQGQECSFQIIEVPSELGAGTRGASLGSAALRVSALNQGATLFRDCPVHKVETANDDLFKEVQHPYAKHLPSLLHVCENIAHTVQRSLTEGRGFPLVLAGDHSTAAATIAGIKMAHPNKRLGVVWIDAHADAHSPYTTPSGNIHGMPVASALNDDNRDRQVNEIDEETAALWEKLKNLGDIAPKIVHEDLVYVAVRDTEAPEDYLMAKHGIKNFSVPEVRQIGPRETARQILARLDQCDLIYISFDVDSMDCAISCGTGTPVPYGIDCEESAEILEELAKSPKVCCLEVAEVNPLLDAGNRMADNTCKILERFLDARG